MLEWIVWYLDVQTHVGVNIPNMDNIIVVYIEFGWELNHAVTIKMPTIILIMVVEASLLVVHGIKNLLNFIGGLWKTDIMIVSRLIESTLMTAIILRIANG